MRWEQLGAVHPRELSDARLQVHWAAQALAAAGAAHVPVRADDSHRNMGWSTDLRALVGHVGPGGRAAGVRPDPLALLVVDGADVGDELPLAGATLQTGFRWLGEQLQPAGKRVDLVRPTYDLPAHPVADGAPFSSPDGSFAEVARWFADAAAILEQIRSENHGASEVRCWPHHFDIATLITVAPSDDPESARTVGVGMTPGDDGIPEPYFYVTPWPAPEKPRLPDLPHGGWNREGWLGAVLTGSDLLSAGDVQATTVLSFLRAAVAAGRALIEEEA